MFKPQLHRILWESIIATIIAVLFTVFNSTVPSTALYILFLALIFPLNLTVITICHLVFGDE